MCSSLLNSQALNVCNKKAVVSDNGNRANVISFFHFEQFQEPVCIFFVTDEVIYLTGVCKGYVLSFECENRNNCANDLEMSVNTNVM